MNMSLDSQGAWRRVATVEVDASVDDLPKLLRDDRFAFRLHAAPRSPSGYQWFELLIDATKGERRAALAAYTILKAMETAAIAGTLAGFRIVHGRQWLDLVTSDHPLGSET